MYVAFVLGLVGSLHCLGMCAPIAMAIDAQNSNRRSFWTGKLLYNLGRIVTYTTLGLVFGAFGQTLLLFVSQQQLSILMGVVLLVSSLTYIFKKQSTFIRPLYKGTSWLKGQFAGLLRSNAVIARFLVGLLNGLLPCGLVYSALVMAAASGDYWQGVIFMVFFGLGTLPLMVGSMLLATIPKIRLSINRILPIISFCIAILFIIRGLNLDIPYLSPKVDIENAQEPVCR